MLMSACNPMETLLAVIGAGGRLAPDGDALLVRLPRAAALLASVPALRRRLRQLAPDLLLSAGNLSISQSVREILQIEQLKDEIREKDQSLVKEHFDHMKVEKEKDNLKGKDNQLRQMMFRMLNSKK